jgi:nicotinamide mononucleotide adenylyltransferase
MVQQKVKNSLNEKIRLQKIQEYNQKQMQIKANIMSMKQGKDQQKSGNTITEILQHLQQETDKKVMLAREQLRESRSRTKTSGTISKREELSLEITMVNSTDGNSPIIRKSNEVFN